MISSETPSSCMTGYVLPLIVFMMEVYNTAVTDKKTIFVLGVLYFIVNGSFADRACKLFLNLVDI